MAEIRTRDLYRSLLHNRCRHRQWFSENIDQFK